MRAGQGRHRGAVEDDTLVCAEVSVNGLRVQLIVRGPQSRDAEIHRLVNALHGAVIQALPGALVERGS